MLQTGIVTSLASEGQGIIRQDGLVTFIPFTAPGDTVTYNLITQKKNFAVGALEKVLEKSPERVTPKCPYFGTCGGCQLQHLANPAQLAWKRQWVEDALRRIGGFKDLQVPPVAPSSAQYAYRRRISLVLRPHQNTYQAGYISVDNKTLLPITECPIFVDPQDPIIAYFQTLCQMLQSHGQDAAKATILKQQNNRYILQFHFKRLPENIEAACQDALAKPFIAGIIASSPQKTLQFGTLETTIDIEGLHIGLSPKAFIQSHPEQSLNIYRAIAEQAEKLQPKTALDLYCGIGITSLLLGRQGITVTGIESNPEATRLANINTKRNGIENTKFITADVADSLEEQLKKNPDYVIVNPPREGLAPKVLATLSAHPVKGMTYVSCMPSTLARDLKQLTQNGYKIESVAGFDMFPQTIHVETMVHLRFAVA